MVVFVFLVGLHTLRKYFHSAKEGLGAQIYVANTYVLHSRRRSLRAFVGKSWHIFVGVIFAGLFGEYAF